MERVIRSLKIGNDTVEVMTKGNFSRMAVSPFLAFLSMFLVYLFSGFEERFYLKILNLDVLSEGENGSSILIHHEPKEKARFAYLPKTEPDIGL